jgi:hypothetical protein
VTVICFAIKEQINQHILDNAGTDNDEIATGLQFSDE